MAATGTPNPRVTGSIPVGRAKERARCKAQYQKHREKRKAKRKARYKENRDKELDYHFHRWRRLNPSANPEKRVSPGMSMSRPRKKKIVFEEDRPPAPKTLAVNDRDWWKLPEKPRWW